ncbi:hypothetical protein BDW60DRAFT_224618 [Aspergillus nidulans var. acristatus]
MTEISMDTFNKNVYKTNTTPIHPFDLASALPQPSTSWSANTTKIRLVLNYKRIPYTQSYTSYPNIAPILSSLGIQPHPAASANPAPYTLRAITHPSLISDRNPHGALLDSLPIAQHLDKVFPGPSIFPAGAKSVNLVITVNDAMSTVIQKGIPLLLPATLPTPDLWGGEYLARTWEWKLGKAVEEMKPSSEIDVQRICEDMAEAMKPVVALLQQTREGVYFEGQQPGFADFVLVGLLAWFKRVDKRVWDAVTGYGKEIKAVWDGCKELLVQMGE